MVTKSSLLTWFGTPVTEADFEEFYRVELPRVYNFFRYRVGDGQLAEDLTSETFEKAWRNRDRYQRNLAAFSTWVFTIARRVAIDIKICFLRRCQRIGIGSSDNAPVIR